MMVWSGQKWLQPVNLGIQAHTLIKDFPSSFPMLDGGCSEIDMEVEVTVFVAVSTTSTQTRGVKDHLCHPQNSLVTDILQLSFVGL